VKRKKLLTVAGSVCLTLVLAALLLPACAPAVEPGTAEIAALQKEVAALEKEVAKLEAAALVPAEVFKWRMQILLGRGEEENMMLNRMSDMIREASDGRLDISNFWAGELIPSKEAFDALTAGTIDLLNSSTGYHFGFFPATLMMQFLPGGMRSPDDAVHLSLSEEWHFVEILRDAYAEYGAYYVGPNGVGAYKYDVMLTEPIERLDDLGELKIRSYGMTSELLAMTGAGMVYLPAEEIYTSVATGVVDGATWTSYAGCAAMKYHEIMKYYVELPGTRGIIGNGNLAYPPAWDALPDDLKLVLSYYSDWIDGQCTQKFALSDKIWKEKMQEEWGVTIITLNEEDTEKWLAIGRDYWKVIAANSPRSREWIEYIAEWMKWRGYLEPDWTLD